MSELIAENSKPDVKSYDALVQIRKFWLIYEIDLTTNRSLVYMNETKTKNWNKNILLQTFNK